MNIWWNEGSFVYDECEFDLRHMESWTLCDGYSSWILDLVAQIWDRILEAFDLPYLTNVNQAHAIWFYLSAPIFCEDTSYMGNQSQWESDISFAPIICENLYQT